ncbi:MAG: VCBS repeat-containing protein [Phaeodactylibacter sp.]|nr:VCBS repeat-containing protein [Phaeodactylibacter sp.]
MQIKLMFGLCLFAGLSLQAQVSFTKIQEGPVATIAGDSRSCNFVDVNGDGRDDIFISNGPSGGQNNRLFLNNGDGTFSTAPASDIVQDGSPSDGATFADADNDGSLDAYVVTWYGHTNYYYHNDGSGVFSLQDNPGLTGLGTFSETASWGDFDNDGLLDLYVTNSGGNRRNLLYHNEGNGLLAPWTTGAWVTDAYTSRSVQWTDINGDGALDLFVANEENQYNNLYLNNGEQNFTRTELAPLTTIARSSTGSSWADIDNDGDFDLFVANYANQNNQLYFNNGDGSFSAVTDGPVVTDGGYSFGSIFGDIDNDGDLDLFVANGFGPVSGVDNFLYLNNGDGTFERDEASIPGLHTQCSYGCAWGDIDNDGFLDLVVANCKGTGQSQIPSSLYHNQGNGHHWLKVRLSGVASNRSGIGAKVRVKAMINGVAVWQVREISAQDGYNCQSSLTAHFGMGDAVHADSLLVEWPSGLRDTLLMLPTDTLFHITESMTSSAVERLMPEGKLRLYPNPGQGMAALEWEGLPAGPACISLYSMDGRRLFCREERLHGGQQRYGLDLGPYQPGMYVVKVACGGSFATLKFIKE